MKSPHSMPKDIQKSTIAYENNFYAKSIIQHKKTIEH